MIYLDFNIALRYKLKMTIEELKQWRRKHEVNQNELAVLLKVHIVTVARWESGVHPIPSFLDLALCELDRRLAVNPLSKKIRKRKEVKTNGSKNQRKKTG